MVAGALSPEKTNLFLFSRIESMKKKLTHTTSSLETGVWQIRLTFKSVIWRTKSSLNSLY